jgi:Fur family transcriptional regulator, stress-responsive regulator
MPRTSTDTTNPEGRDPVAAALREAGYRVTSQRLVIHAALTELGHHLSAEEVFEAVSPRLPNVSLPTVYAGLDALEDAGLVRRVAAGRGRALYDAGGHEHHHLVCRRCGRVEDLEAPVRLSPALSAAADSGFAAEGAEVVVRGLCADCRP